jgi:hypothetical protein
MVIDRLERSVNTEKCDAFAGLLHAELDLPIHHDWMTIEFAPGINASFGQFWDRIRRATDRAVEIVREYDLDLFPAGAHPIEGIFNAAHVHVGSIHDESEGIRLENHMLQYVPAMAAMAANSPLSHGRVGEFKSYRVRHLAHGCTRPGSVRDPHFSQSTWGGDASPKLFGAPTMEVRIIDCASSRRLLAEMATFIAAFLHRLGENVPQRRPTRREYRDCLTNRWAAARYGMQATFLWGGKARPVADVLDEMLDQCADALAGLGVKRSGLTLINTMIRKRVCQADFALSLARRYADPYLLTSAYAKMVRHWEACDEYFATAAALEPMPAPDEKAILNEHLTWVGEGTHFYRLRNAMYYPAPLANEIMERMVRRGLVRREVTHDRGMLLHRIP